MCVVLFFLASRQPSYIDLDVWQRIISLSYLVAAGGVTYLAVLVLAGMRMRDLKHV
jgi:hypothetical protein